MSLKILAIRVKKEWQQWMIANLRSWLETDEECSETIVKRLSADREIYGKSHCYAMDSPDVSTLVHAAARSVFTGEDQWVCIVGDSFLPALFTIATSDIPKVLMNAARKQEIVVIVPQNWKGGVSVDITEEFEESAEITLCGWGDMASKIENLQYEFPGGTLFRAN